MCRNRHASELDSYTNVSWPAKPESSRTIQRAPSRGPAGFGADGRMWWVEGGAVCEGELGGGRLALYHWVTRKVMEILVVCS